MNEIAQNQVISSRVHNRLPKPVYSLTIRVAGPARRGDGAPALRVGGGEGAARPARRGPGPRPRRRRPGERGAAARQGRRGSRAGRHHFDGSSCCIAGLLFTRKIFLQFNC